MTNDSKRKLAPSGREQGKENKKKSSSRRPRANSSPNAVIGNGEGKPSRRASSDNLAAGKKNPENAKRPVEAPKANQQQLRLSQLVTNNPKIVWTSESSLIAAFEAKQLPLDELKHDELKELKPANIKIAEPKKQQSKPNLKLKKPQSSPSAKKVKESARSERKKSSGKADIQPPIRPETKEKPNVKAAIVSPPVKVLSNAEDMLQEVTPPMEVDEESTKSPNDFSSPLLSKQNSSGTSQDDNVPTVFERIDVKPRPVPLDSQKPTSQREIGVDEASPTVFEKIDKPMRPFIPASDENKQATATTDATCKPAEKKEDEQTPKSPSNESPKQKPAMSVYMPILPSYY